MKRLPQRDPQSRECLRGAGRGTVGSISSSGSRAGSQRGLRSCGQAGLRARWGPARLCRTRACRAAGLTGVAIVEFVVEVAGGVPVQLILHPVGVGVEVVAHEHAEEDHQGHLQEQAGERQAPAEVGVPGHAAGRLARRAAAGSDARGRERLLRPGQGRGGGGVRNS